MEKKKNIRPQCAECSVKLPVCESGDEWKSPAFCPAKNCKSLIKKALKEHEKPEIREFARMASIQENARLFKPGF